MLAPPLPREDLDHILSHTRNLWDDLRGQRIFITGGTGFFGIWLLESFCHANDQLGLQARAVVLTRNPDAFLAKTPHLTKRADLEFVAGDVRDFDFPDGDFPHVIHAGTTSSAPVEPLEMFATIVEGTRRVLDFAATHGTRKLLFVSSGAVYGRQPPDLTHIPEDYAGAPDPLDPASAYGEGKRAAELLTVLAGRQHGFETKIARCFAFVGPHLPLDAHFAIGNFIRDALAHQPIQVTGDGSPMRSYLYASDLAAWLWTLLVHAPSRRVYHIGSDDDLSIIQLARLVNETLGNSANIEIIDRDHSTRPISRYVPSVLRAQQELGLQVTVPLADAISRTARWIRTAPAS
jgi:dTDP-glucose 4,6-dehydratase